MTWQYDPNLLSISTSVGRLYSVRLLVGDTDPGDQQALDEEINFALTQATNNVYKAAAFVCRLIAAKYSREVTSSADRGVSSDYSDRITHYTSLANQIEISAKKLYGKTLGIFSGGVLVSDITLVVNDTNRVPPKFSVDQFNNPSTLTSNFPVIT